MKEQAMFSSDDSRDLSIPAEERASPGERIVLPMSSGKNILPGESVQIKARSKHEFRPERLIIGGTPSNWSINGIWIGDCSQFSQIGDVPGEMFAATTIERMSFDEVLNTDFIVLATFIGSSELGEPFVCAVLGAAI